MPASLLPSVPISINVLILLAYKRAGILPVEATLAGANMTPKLEHGRQLMDLLLDSLAPKGFIARTTDFYDLPIIAGELQYTLPDSILDVFEDAMFVPSTNPDTKHTTSELVCAQVGVSTYQTITTKGSISSRPTIYASFRSGATVMIKVWPVPSEDGTLRLKTIRLLGGNADGTKTPDLQRYWFDALVWCLAYTIAVDSTMLERAAYLGPIAEAKEKECIAYSYEHTGSQAVLAYTTQWSH